MERREIVRGEFHHVDCAIRQDGSCPAGEFLDALKSGMWDRDEAAEPLDEQLSEYHWFLNAIRHWARTGEPVYKDAVKSLKGGIWELRHGDKRLTFYDTDGKGGYTAKRPIHDYTKAEAPDSQYWQIPYFDKQIRLGYAFPKISQKTLDLDLDESLKVREEDLAHDRECNEGVG